MQSTERVQFSVRLDPSLAEAMRDFGDLKRWSLNQVVGEACARLARQEGYAVGEPALRRARKERR